MAYLDIWDIIRDRGFWEGVGSGEEVNGRLGSRGCWEGWQEALRSCSGGRWAGGHLQKRGDRERRG